MREFKSGQKLKTVSGGEITVLEKIGGGGQGTVYRVSYRGKELALKWYTPHSLEDPDKFYKNLENNIAKGSPTESFLWPMELTERAYNSFGYLMRLCPPEYKGFHLFLLAKERYSGIEAVINAALQISSGFRALHNAGFSYQDINDGNFFINPRTGDVLICDNDNVAAYGKSFGIAGKSRYMAPEIVMGKAKPSEHTDRFSLAVMLYRMLFMDHPLEGQNYLRPCMRDKEEREIYGTNPVFVWDPKDNSNRPVRGVHVNELHIWPAYPKFIHKLFAEAFSREALIGQDVTHRVLEKQWQEAFIALRDCKIRCSCGEETFIDVEKETSKCFFCGRELKRPMILKVKKNQVVLLPGKKLYDCHVNCEDGDFRKIQGEVVRGRTNPSTLWLRNLSDNSWKKTKTSGEQKIFGKGEERDVEMLSPGSKFDFGGGNEGVVL